MMKMRRRNFLKCCSYMIPGVMMLGKMGLSSETRKRVYIKYDDDYIKKLADVAISKASSLGAYYTDFRVTNYISQNISTREQTVQSVNESENFGFSVRVIIDETWGFAASSTLTEDEAIKITVLACELAKTGKSVRRNPVILSPNPVYNDFWKTPVQRNSFDVPVSEKVDLLLEINRRAKELGGSYCSSFIWSVNEHKHFISSEGSYIKQDIHRIWPNFEVTVLDKDSGDFETLESNTEPMGMGYEYVENFDFFSDVERAVEHAKMKLKAPSVAEGRKDLILDPAHLWLTIHETCGHPTELDRALGYEANYAGTSFMTPDKHGKLKYGSEIVNIRADRTQPKCLATRAYDDDGVKTTEWDIIKDGIFVGYQTTRETARFIGENMSNGCAYADSWARFPIQRMPNVSLMPGKKKLSLSDLISDTEDGIFIKGSGSWSIDMQRYNFQFTGQEFWEIKNGKIVGMLRDVAYQGNTVEFWNSCDAICDESEYKLGGSFFCGKGEPGQVSPVSHGSSPARFRNISILNTSKEVGK